MDVLALSAPNMVDSDDEQIHEYDEASSVAESEQSLVSERGDDDGVDERPPWLPFPVDETGACAGV